MPPTGQVPPLSPRLRAALEALPILRLRLRLRLLDELTAEPFLGNLIRGQVGALLHAQAPETFRALMGSESGARCWTLEAPWASSPIIPPGTLLDCQVTLVGTGVGHASALISAFAGLAQRGLGPADASGQRAAVAFEGVERLCTPGTPQGSDDGDDSLTAASVFDSAPGLVHSGLRLQLHRPLCIKQQGRILMTAPSAEQLLRRAFGRLVQLLPPQAPGAAGQGSLFQPAEHAAWMALAQRTTVQAVDLRPCLWQRRSHRTQADMPIQGLVGQLLLSAPGGALLPWLRLCEWLHLGSKTTFGFGALKADLLP